MTKYRWYLLIPLLLLNGIAAYQIMGVVGVVITSVGWIAALIWTVGLSETKQ